MTLPSGIDDISPQWLTYALSESILAPRGAVTALDVRPFEMPLSLCAHITTHYASGPAEQLFLKLSRTDAILAITTDDREVSFYGDLCRQMTDPPVPKCLYAEYDLVTQRSLLLLEDLSASHYGRPLSQIPPSPAEMEQIVDAIAEYQAFWWDHPKLRAGVGNRPTREPIDRYCAWARSSYTAFYEDFGSLLSPTCRELYTTTLDGLPAALTDRLVGGRHLTLYHGDSHIGNYLFPISGGRACIIDWQGWGVELGTFDLVSLMALFWHPARRQWLEEQVLHRYHERLLQRGVPPDYTWERCWNDYRLAILKALFFPLAHWKAGLSSDMWWNHFERISAAAKDLDCAALLPTT